MFKEYKDLWKDANFWNRLLIILFSPIGILIGIAYGLILIFWNRYGLVFICGMILLQPDDTSEEAVARGQAAALLVGLILLCIRAYKKRNRINK
jgi:hypothetical protein